MPLRRALAAAALAVGLAASASAAQAAPVTAGAPSAAAQVVAKASPNAKEYQNCTALNKVYPHGVGKPGAHDKGGNVTSFTRDAKTYAKNTKSDRDKDGIACEK